MNYLFQWIAKERIFNDSQGVKSSNRFHKGLRRRVACAVVAGLHHSLFSKDCPCSETLYRINRKPAFSLRSKRTQQTGAHKLKNEN